MTRSMFIFLLMAALSQGGLADDSSSFLVIAHASTVEDSISETDLQDLYLGRKRTWDSGQRVKLTHSRTEEAFASFSRKVLQKSLRQFSMFWKHMILTGKGSMPKHFAVDKDAIEYVRTTPGAIAIVSAAMDRAKVKVIKLIE